MQDMTKVPEKPPELTPEQEKARREEIARLKRAVAYGDADLAKKPKPPWWVENDTEKKRKKKRKDKRKKVRKARKKSR